MLFFIAGQWVATHCQDQIHSFIFFILYASAYLEYHFKMTQVLYRKYRPNSFKELAGQDHIKRILQESVNSGSISHAYLFSGPRGTGKTTTARIMSKALNCLNFPDSKDVCNNCEHCNLINANNAIDIIEMDAASNRGIEEIRVLKESINFVPSFLKYKIYIIDEVHMLTKEAFNALLKTLEEPPAHVVFILATTEPHKLPITILSRVQRFDFGLGDEEQIISKLKHILESDKISYDEKVLKLVYRFSGGSFRDAESLLSKLVGNSTDNNLDLEDVKEILGLIDEEILSELLNNVLQKNLSEALANLDHIENNSTDLGFFVVQFITFLKDKIVENIKKSEVSGIHQVVRIIDELIRAKANFRSFDDKKILLQIAIIKLASNGESVAVADSPKPQPEADKKVNPSIKADDPVPEQKPSESKPKDIQHSNKAEELIKAAGEFQTRLKAILLVSNVDFNEESIVITTEYQFNAKYLEKPEIRQFLQNWMDQNYKADVKIEVVKGVTSENVGINSDIETEPSASDTMVEDVDNSAIVENIL